MSNSDSQKPEDSEPKAKESQSPKAAHADNSVVKAQGSRQNLTQKVADAAGAPKDSQKSGQKAAVTQNVDMFRQLCGLSSDQSYAFVAWAKAEQLEDRSVADWQKKLQDFQSRVV